MNRRHVTTHLTNNRTQFTPDELKMIRLSFTSRQRIDETLNKFQYKEANKYAQNIGFLFQILFKALELESSLKTKFFQCFSEYLNVQQNIPIQVNLKKIKYDQLTYLLDQWQNSMNEPSLIRHPDRLYSIQHRNIIFSRIFVEQRQNIEDYFETLSEKRMLKGVDLYQLIVDILSHYFLYEYCSDNEPFFQKINSFNNFLQIVDKFVNSERRIIIDNKSKDFDYIKLYEFQALIYFWESINPQLQLRSDKRYNNSNKQIQTERHQMLMYVNMEVQTIQSKENIISLEQIINNTLKQLNKLTEVQDQPEKLQIMQNICQNLRKEKIKLTLYQKNNSTQKISKLNQLSSNTYTKQQNFLDLNSDQKSKQLPKKQTSSMQFSQIPQQKREFTQKRKQLFANTEDKQVESYSRNLNDQQILEQMSLLTKKPQSLMKNKLVSSQNLNQNQSSSSSLALQLNNFQKNDLRLDNISSESEEINNHTGLRRIDTASENGNIMFNLLEIIYLNYSNGHEFMNIQKLNRFFVDIGIIQEKQSLFSLGSFRKVQMKNPNQIKKSDFFEIMDLVMKQDEDLTIDVVAEFVDLYIRKLPEYKTEDKLKNYDQSKLINNTRPSQTRCSDLSQIQVRQRQLSYTSSTKKINSSPSYHRIPSYLRDGNSENESRRKRYAYCQETPKFKNQVQINRFTQNRNQLSLQKKNSLPLPSYRKRHNLKF